MIFIWGKKIVAKPLGKVRDFCPICRDLQGFTLVQLRKVPHFYYIPLGRGEAVGHQIVCLRCGTALAVKPENYERVTNGVEAKDSESAEGLSPAAAAAAQARLRLEQRVKAGGLTPEERKTLIEEPFTLLNPRMETRGASTRLDRKSGLALAVTVGVPILLLILEPHVSGKAADALSLLNITTIIVGLGTTIYLVATDRSRFYRTQIEPLLIKALTPLEPREEELQQVKAKHAQLGKAIVKSIDVRRLSLGVADAAGRPAPANAL